RRSSAEQAAACDGQKRAAPERQRVSLATRMSYRDTLIIFTVCLALTGCAGSRKQVGDRPRVAPDAEFARFCEAKQCRGRTVVDLVRDDGTMFHLDMPLAPPVIQPGFVSIYPGESIVIEADEEAGRLINLRTVEHIDHPDR